MQPECPFHWELIYVQIEFCLKDFATVTDPLCKVKASFLAKVNQVMYNLYHFLHRR